MKQLTGGTVHIADPYFSIVMKAGKMYFSVEEGQKPLWNENSIKEITARQQKYYSE